LKIELTYLGHVISKKGVKPDPKKLEAGNFSGLKHQKIISWINRILSKKNLLKKNFSKLASHNLLKK